MLNSFKFTLYLMFYLSCVVILEARGKRVLLYIYVSFRPAQGKLIMATVLVQIGVPHFLPMGIAK